MNISAICYNAALNAIARQNEDAPPAEPPAPTGGGDGGKGFGLGEVSGAINSLVNLVPLHGRPF